MARGAGWIVAALAAALIGAPAALADGGQTISGATAIVPGQQEFGNTANGAQDSSGIYHSYWTLSVTAGDQVTIDWEIPPASDNDDPLLRVYPIGTTDFNVDNTDPAEEQDLNSNGRNELVFAATVTGTMPVDFRSAYGDSAGPYDFTVHVLHDVRLSLPSLSSLPLTGSVQVGVHNPDGVALSDPGLVVYLQIKEKHGTWTNLASAAASAGVATITYTAPTTLSGEKVSLRAVSAGSGYLTDSTASEKVLVGDEPTGPGPVTKPVHHKRHHRHRRHHRHHRHRRHRHRGHHRS